MNVHEDRVIEQALEIIARRLDDRGPQLRGTTDTADYLRLVLGTRKQEVFAVLFLDAQHRVIEFREMFFGTIDCSNVYPREVVRAVIETNAAAVILAHNHPSGCAEPSRGDIELTERLTDVLEIIDTRVLDHFVVTPDRAISMAEQGLL